MVTVSLPLEKDRFESGKIYETDWFDADSGPGEHRAKLKIGVFESEGGYEVRWQLIEESGSTTGGSSGVVDLYQAKWEFWRVLGTLPSWTGVYEVWTNSDRVHSETPGKEDGEKSQLSYEDSTQTDQQMRREAIKSDNNRIENLEENRSTQDTPSNQSRGLQENPSSTNDSVGGSWADNLESGISGWFQPGMEGAAKLKGDLEKYIDEGGSPFLAAVGATLLDFSTLGMNVAAGTPLGILDLRRIGEGVAKGTWEGVREDAGRVLSVIPQGKILKAVDRALTATKVLESAAQGDYANAILTTTAVLGGQKNKPHPSKNKLDLGKGKTKNEQWIGSGKLKERVVRNKEGKVTKTQRTLTRQHGDRLTTDEHGRITKLTGEIKKEHLNTGTDATRSARKNVQKAHTVFDAGHLRAKLLGGLGGLKTTFPQFNKMNRGKFNKFEGGLAEIVRGMGEKDKLVFSVQLRYKGNAHAPTQVVYIVKLNGKKVANVIFSNKPRRPYVRFLAY